MAMKPSKSLYLEKYGNTAVYKFPTCFKKFDYNPGDNVHLRVSQIYDPTKFWIVSKYRELEFYQKCLFNSYYLGRNKYRIREEDLEIEMYCVVFIDGGFYRGVILNFPSSDQKIPPAQIYFMDYGMVKLVPKDCLFYMTEECFQVPQFVIRASLAGISPKGLRWTPEDVVEFHHLVDDKILVGVVVNVDSQREVVEFNLCEAFNGQMYSINKALIQGKRARYFDEEPEIVEAEGTLQPHLDYPHLFPSHEVIESGKVPTSLGDEEYQLQFGTTSSLSVERYFINEDMYSI